jgi:hypothetical protein
MDFREATDELLDRPDHAELAKALGVSVASVRQARLKPTASAHRSAPTQWQKVIIRLAEQQRHHFDALIERLRGEERGSPIQPTDGQSS